ncbi:hypothetical protein P9G84_22105 [Brevibacillus centrosporus]|uniref:hypothetical protein n=1 Tax=Brevibacillus centrosporus TaxID=54910 RepID=UPI000F09DB42|nr:hypothetical protein [Brevibacillus centrosporus]MEC2131621.1 hypothetical protein [Brevibacillus centrosporus]RNB72109.1 hypothetical protein EDM55_06865 [Brevibacillus centrosporus]GED35084.1 hypothetical protein BCE02nite_62250 [Brevibacillus centrosporus]
MTPEQRNQARLDLLKELYDYHFQNGGRAASINTEKEGKTDNELVTAIQYLDDKNLIEGKILHRAAYQAKITAYGIDLIESGGSLR